jgi:uncharacterized protein
MNVLALGVSLLLQSPALPALTGRVVDSAGILSSSEEAALTERLAAIENETSVQIVVATIPTLGGEPIEDFSIRLAEEWKIGQAGLDNGAIVVVVPSERRIRIEVGYGLEAVIPDGLAGRIIRERIAPAFQQNDYYGGLLSAIEGLELATQREYPEAPDTSDRSDEPTDFGLGALFFGYMVLGGLGNAFGILVAMIGGAILLTVFGGSLAQMMGWWSVPLGAFLGLLATLMLRSSGRRGGWTHYGGSGSGGGFSGGGSFGGGGFSGGGGRFGGGGASGSW